METLTEGPPTRADPPPSEHRRPLDRRRSDWRLLAFGMLVSVLVHGLIFAIASRVLLVPGETEAPPPGEATGAPTADVMRAVDIIEVASAEAPEPTAPEERDEPPAEAEPVPAAPPAAPDPDAGADEATERRPMSAAERLRPRVGDRRLWRSPGAAGSAEEPTDMDRARTRIGGKVAALNDSIAAAMEAERRARDWTFEDEDGNRWGIGPDGQLHLGGIKIPVPISFPLSPDAQARIGEWNAIRSHAAREAVREYLEQRAEAIRARKEQERDTTQTGGDPGGTSPE